MRNGRRTGLNNRLSPHQLEDIFKIMEVIMKQNKRTHLRGQRGQAFADLVRGIPAEQILCVSIDVSKDFHFVLIHNALGEIVTPYFEIANSRHGYEQLVAEAAQARAASSARVVLVGMEPTGHYFENLARAILASGQAVTLVNSFAVKKNRSQQMMAREKTDEIDAAAIGDLLRRGEGHLFRPVTGVYLQLQQLERLRARELKIQTQYKNRIIARVDVLFPGLVLTKAAQERGVEPLFKVPFWECVTLQQLLRVCPDSYRLAKMETAELIAGYHAHGHRMGPVYARRILAYARQALWPDPEVAAVHGDLLALELRALETVTDRIADLEARMEALLRRTPYQILAQVRGVTPVMAAAFAGAVGDPHNFTHSRQVVRFSGLVSGRDDSGARQKQGKQQRVVKTGSVHLRRVLGVMLNGLLRHQPVLSAYHHKLKQRKNTGVARVATMRRALGILWATVRDQEARTLVMRGGANM
jgi:transposase